MILLPYIFDHLSLILFVALVVLLLIYIVVRFPIYHLEGKHFYGAAAEGDTEVPVTVVVIVHNQEQALEHSLEVLATQHYSSYEVIVVDDNSTDGSTDVVTRFENRYPHIRHTFIPATARYVSRSKLAITLGVRAAKNEWIVLLEGNSCPVGSDWLKSIAGCCRENYDLVLGYNTYATDSTLRASRLTLDRLVRQLRLFHAAAAYAGSQAVGGDNGNLAFRKSVFLEHKGFYNHLSLLGADDLLFVDTVAKAGRTAVVVTPEATVAEQLPTDARQWDTYRLIQAEALRQLSQHGQWERLRWGLSTCAIYFSIVLTCALLVWQLLHPLHIFAMVGMGLSLCVFVLDEILFYRVARRLGEEKFLGLLPCYNLTQPLFNAVYKLRSIRLRSRLQRGI